VYIFGISVGVSVFIDSKTFIRHGAFRCNSMAYGGSSVGLHPLSCHRAIFSSTLFLDKIHIL